MPNPSEKIVEYTFVVSKENAGKRLDKFLGEQEEIDVTRAQIKKRISEQEILVNNLVEKSGYKTKTGDSIFWRFRTIRPLNAIPQDIDLVVLFENEDIAFVEKPSGMVVHPSTGHPDQTLVNALLFHFQSLSKGTQDVRPGIVHRIDKDTSGVLVVAKNDHAHQTLVDIFREHALVREYHAICYAPSLSDSGTFETLHTRDPKNRFRYTGVEQPNDTKKRQAITHYEVLERFPNKYALIKCRLETGRTHQIRMHLLEANAPIISDELYGFKNTIVNRFIDRVALHAHTLSLEWKGEQINIESKYPTDFANALEKLRKL